MRVELIGDNAVLEIDNRLFPLKVVNYGTPWASLRLPESMVLTVSAYLSQENVWHRLGEHIISLNGQVPMTNIWFKRGAEILPIQATLDRMPRDLAEQ